MSVQIIFRHGLESHRLSITPRLGEPIYTIDENRLYIGDSTTPGGIPVKCDVGSIGGFPFNPSGTPADGDTLIFNGTTGEWEYGSAGGGGGGCTTLNCLTDVDTTGASVNQVLSWNGTQWVPATVSGGGGGPIALDDLTDVSTSGEQNGDILSFDGSQWVPVAPEEVGAGLKYSLQMFMR